MKILKRQSALNITSLICTTLVFFLLFTLSCTKKVGLKTKSTVVAQCDTISDAEDIAPIIAANCSINGCHVQPTPAGPGVMLDTYELLKAKGESGRIKARVLDAEPPSSMPPQGLNEDQQKLIECWLNNGYKP